MRRRSVGPAFEAETGAERRTRRDIGAAGLPVGNRSVFSFGEYLDRGPGSCSFVDEIGRKFGGEIFVPESGVQGLPSGRRQ